MSYQNGSVWPHDNALIAAGFARYGHKSAIARAFKGLFDEPATWTCDDYPNCFADSSADGSAVRPFIRSPARRRPGPPERHFCSFSPSWSEFDPDHNEIRLRKPRLPPFLDEVILRDLELVNRPLI